MEQSNVLYLLVLQQAWVQDMSKTAFILNVMRQFAQRKTN